MCQAKEISPIEIPPIKKTGSKQVRDASFGFGIALIAFVFAYWVIPAAVVRPPNVKSIVLLPSFLPYALTVGVGALGFVCGLQACFGAGVPSEDGEGLQPSRNWPLRLLSLAAVLAGYYLLPDVVGMLGISILSMVILLWAGGERSIIRGGLVAVLLPLGVYLFFSKVAQVPLPEGAIFTLSGGR